jgi:hypothetical protein
MDQPKSILTSKISPYYQAAAVIGIMLIFDLFSLGSKDDNALTFAKSVWTNHIAMVLFYILANCMLSLGSDSNLKYVRDSIFAYLALVFVGGLISYGISGMSLDTAGSFRWILMVLSMGYLIFLAMINTMKFVVTLAKKQDSRLRGE